MSGQLTVLMTVYNGCRYLRTAIDSILKQTYRDFRFLVVDDASTENTRAVVRAYDDDRIELLCLDRNIGQTAALNVGLRRASTPWIARMDADDYSAPTRLEEQIGALDGDRSVSCVGTYAWEFHDDPAVIESIITRPERHGEIKRAVVKGPPLIHGSIVVSRAALLDVGAYDERYRYSADLELYVRLLEKYRARNIPRPLLGIRRHDNQGSFSKIAADEKVEIFSRLLSSRAWPAEDLAAVRASLSHAYFFRSWVVTDRGSRGDRVKDLLASFRLAPRTFAALLFGSLLRDAPGRKPPGGAAGKAPP